MIATCVTLTKELSNCKVYKVIEQIDVSDSSGIERLVVELNGAKIDLLVNNAGMMSVREPAVSAYVLSGESVDPVRLCTPRRRIRWRAWRMSTPTLGSTGF